MLGVLAVHVVIFFFGHGRVILAVWIKLREVIC